MMMESARRRKQTDAETEVMGPEELVRRETRAVNFLRGLVIFVLIIVGGILSFGSYKIGSKWEEDAYQREFAAISSRLTSSFVGVVSQTMWSAFALGAVVTASSDLATAAPNITIPLFDKLGAGAVQSSRLAHVFWAPLIHNESQRLQWEDYAQHQLNTTSSSSTGQCNPCGSADLTIGTLGNQVVTPFGTYTCSDMSWAAQKGLIAPKDCPVLASYVLSSCNCISVTNATAKAATSSTKPRSNYIFSLEGNAVTPVEGPGPNAPLWQIYPETADWVFYDIFTDPTASLTLKAMLRTQATVISPISDEAGDSIRNSSTAGAFMLSPVFSSQNDGNHVIGAVGFSFGWKNFLAAVVPLGSNGIIIVLENTCGVGEKFTFMSKGDTVEDVGIGDLHDPNFSDMNDQSSYADYSQLQRFAAPLSSGKTSGHNCFYRIRVYPSAEFHGNFISNKPRIYAAAVILIFVFACVVFVVYDCYVAARQRKVMKAALQRDEIVSSLFPAEVQERLFQRNQSNQNEPRTMRSSILNAVHSKGRRGSAQSVSSAGTSDSELLTKRAEPIADFFPSVTVVFADISGFTAWSSEREPSQVFQLLETVYQAFDEIAKRMGVFKLETIGDCYVAAAGIPVYQPDHAVRILEFAHECILQMHMLTHELEATLGPSTSALSIRIGVHSGPVIAGVLRGVKSRFQLFGDTMNTTSRMQTTSEINMIQISSATANLLEAAGKSHWVQPRAEKVAMKGKGLVQTYWADTSTSVLEGDNFGGKSALDQLPSSSENGWHCWGQSDKLDRLYSRTTADDKTKRLVEWNTDLLLRLLRKIVAARQVPKKGTSSGSGSSTVSQSISSQHAPFEDIVDVLPVKAFPEKTSKVEVDPDSVDLGETVRSQLQDYIATIASMYRDNPFHNFEHASHVAMSAAKVVKRIIKPDIGYSHDAFTNRKGRESLKRTIHYNTFGISSDVLMQFAVVFSAVIHDVDHTGVSNAQLVKECNELALKYQNKCVAEQNSVDIAWNILLKDQYKELLDCICDSDLEQQRFRQLLVNAVIATDIADKELQQERRRRWDCAFEQNGELVSEKMDRKATIVFEYIIQASDVAHTMQHWSVYKQWNERLFEERYLVFQNGRDEQDPSTNWYEGEIGFFDHYIIPLAKKLETCGVFGVSSDEYLRYALENRHEWELKGRDIVRGMIDKYRATQSQENQITQVD